MATVKIILRKKKLSNGSYPICIRLYTQGDTYYIRLNGLSCSQSQWNKELSRFRRNKDDYKHLNFVLSETEQRIDLITTRLLIQGQFSYDNFLEMYQDKRKKGIIVDEFEKRIKELERQNRLGNAIYYRSCKNVVIEFTKSNSTTFDSITHKWINNFKDFQLQKGNKVNTIAAYLKGIRAIVNRYHKENNLPIPSIDYEIKIEETRHRALTGEQFKKFLDFVPNNLNQQRTKDIFLFSFYCYGANLIDMAQLTKGNIVNNRIEYKRSKTKRGFSIPICNQLQEILNRYDGSNYLLPILNTSDTPMKYQVNFFNRNLNRTLNKIGKLIGADNLTFYYARYTFASTLRDSGTSIDIISQLLGHSNVIITKTYLAKFNNSVLDNVTQNIFSSVSHK